MLGIILDRSSARSLGRQLCDSIRSRILSGELPGAYKLPSTRALAKDIGLSRNLVLSAFEQLQAEGYLEGRTGSGSYVAVGAAIRKASTASAGAARRGASLSERENSPKKEGRIDFRTGLPALDRFPREAWARALSAAARRLPSLAYGYGDPEGLPELRSAVAAYLYRSRGVMAGAADVVITSGTTQALMILSRLLRDNGKTAVLENPSHAGFWKMLARTGVPMAGAAVDGQGLDPRSLPDVATAFVYVTPSHQFPLGAVLPAPRRAALVEWAGERGTFIIEDDYDGEYRYAGPPVMPLRELAPERVAYVGSFSKSFSPALRLGYAVLPSVLREGWRFYKLYSDVHSPIVDQAAMAAFLGEGALERHVHRMRRLYAARRNALLEALRAGFGDDCRIRGEAAGLHLAASFPGISFGAALLSGIEDAGVRVYPARFHSFEKREALADVILLGYGHLDEEAIGEGVRRLAAALGRKIG